ncbi:hypothetical protein AB6A40_002607 [Gnathostoma spinigerum]|uniref:Uncharacterized protein n=1 Tax=Gnathostoma spinigerum TaxID=75299 RepID=A0ABD6EG47_9BILA
MAHSAPTLPYHMRPRICANWVVIITFFAGISATIKDSTGSTFITDLKLTLLFIALSSSVCAALANVSCLITPITANISATSEGLRNLVIADSVANIVEFILCGLSVFFILLLLSKHSEALLSRDSRSSSINSLIVGVVLVVLSEIKLFLWAVQVLGASYSGSHTVFTVNEPTWTLCSIITGILCILQHGRTPEVCRLTTILGSTCVLPSILYVWADHYFIQLASIRAMDGSISSPVIHSRLLANTDFTVGVLQIIALLAVVLHSSRSVCPSLKIVKTSSLRLILIVFGSLCVILSLSLLVLDRVSIEVSGLHRLFGGFGKYTPFLSAIISIFAFIGLIPSTALFALPLMMTFIAICIRMSFIPIFVYLYLSWHTFFIKDLCDLFHYGDRACENPLTRVTALLHFTDALLHLILISSCIFVAYVIWQIFRGQTVLLARLPTYEADKSRCYEKNILVLAIITLIPSSFTFISVATEMFNSYVTASPVVTLMLFGKTCNTALLLFYPIVQVTASNSLRRYPLITVALLMLIVSRFIDALNELEALQKDQSVEIFCDFSLLGLNFTTVVYCLKLLQIIIAENRCLVRDQTRESTDETFLIDTPWHYINIG